MKSHFTVLFTVLLIALFGVGNCGITSSSTTAGVDDELSKLKAELIALQDAFGKFKSANTRNEGMISNLSRTSPPVGSVVAFAGAWPPKDSKGKQWSEDELGWLHCDLRDITEPKFEELRSVLGTDRLPDYRGYFLRGLDTTGERDKGRLVDGGKRESRALGSQQGFLTASPRENPFTTGNQTDNPNYRRLTYRHSFVFKTGNDQSASYFTGWEKPNEGGYERPKTEGNHTHTITNESGDPETRPMNVAVYWIIKFK